MALGALCHLRRQESLIWLSAALLFLVPSPIRTFWQDGTSPPASQQESRAPTTYLDGLRGVAALIVYQFHLSVTLDSTVLLGYGPGLGDSFIHLPIIRILRAGPAMVRIFFILSGFVLTISPANLLHYPKQAEKFHRSIALAVVKRPLRLFLPPLIVTFAMMLLVAGGLYPTLQELNALPAGLLNQTVAHQSTLLLQVGDWLGFVTRKLTNPWAWTEEIFTSMTDSYYGVHLWTIQAEFRCSLIMYGILEVLAITRSPVARGVLQALLIAFCVAWSRWDVALFLVGMSMSLADSQRASHGMHTPLYGRLETGLYVDDDSIVAAEPEAKPRGSIRPHGRASVVLLQLCHHCLLLAGLWATSFPDRQAHDALGFGLATQLCPSSKFWQSLGATAIVWSAGRIEWVKACLSSKALQYLASISFSLYLVHLPFLEMIGSKLQIYCREYISRTIETEGLTTSFTGLVGNAFGFLVVTTLLLWISDIARRAIDEPSQRFLKWFIPRITIEV